MAVFDKQEAIEELTEWINNDPGVDDEELEDELGEYVDYINEGSAVKAYEKAGKEVPDWLEDELDEDW